MSSVIESPSSPGSTTAEAAPNTVALIGVILTAVAVGLCAILFALVAKLPDGIEEFRQLQNDTPAQLRLLILGCTTAVLASVGFLLCIIGLLMPNRRRLLAAAGTALSATLLLGVFGVLALGAILNPSGVETNQSSSADTINPPQ